MDLELRVLGRGPAVVFLHGSPTTHDLFDRVAAHVAKYAQSILVSFPGYGQSAALSAPWATRDLHAAVEDSLLARGVEEASLVGFSSGAYHAFAIACRGRVRVSAIASLAGFLDFAAEERGMLRHMAAAVAAGQDLREAAIARFLSPGARTPENVAAIDAWLAATSRENSAAELLASADVEDLTSRVGQLDIPILARVGSEDVACPRAKSEAIARAAKRAVLQIVPGAGHALTLEDAEDSAEAVLKAVCA
jgi:pimeloyl-ACP methyl ester carboxylesterase